MNHQNIEFIYKPAPPLVGINQAALLLKAFSGFAECELPYDFNAKRAKPCKERATVRTPVKMRDGEGNPFIEWGMVCANHSIMISVFDFLEDLTRPKTVAALFQVILDELVLSARHKAIYEAARTVFNDYEGLMARRLDKMTETEKFEIESTLRIFALQFKTDYRGTLEQIEKAKADQLLEK